METQDNAKRKLRVERLSNFCEEALTKVVGKYNQLYSFADETTDPEALRNDLELWLKKSLRKTAKNSKNLLIHRWPSSNG